VTANVEGSAAEGVNGRRLDAEEVPMSCQGVVGRGGSDRPRTTTSLPRTVLPSDFKKGGGARRVSQVNYRLVSICVDSEQRPVNGWEGREKEMNQRGRRGDGGA